MKAVAAEFRCTFLLDALEAECARCGHSELDHNYWMLALTGKRGCDLCVVEVAEHDYIWFPVTACGHEEEHHNMGGCQMCEFELQERSVDHLFTTTQEPANV